MIIAQHYTFQNSDNMYLQLLHAEMESIPKRISDPSVISLVYLLSCFYVTNLFKTSIGFTDILRRIFNEILLKVQYIKLNYP
jgi:hypothetical protein